MIIALNNKSNFTKEEFINYNNELNNIELKGEEVIIFPTDTYLALFNSNSISLGSQNVSKFGIGAHTGEVACEQLKSLNVKYSLVGHSERRLEQKEDNASCNLKVKRLLENDITPVLCIGETAQEKNANMTSFIIEEELTEDLNGVDPSKVIIAYEPIYSIGTGVIADVFSFTFSKSTSPHTFPSSFLLIPTSITTALFFTISSVTNFGFPIAQTIISACFVISLIFCVLE